LDDPVLEVKNPEPRKPQKATEREQLIAPLHRGDVEARARACQSLAAGNCLFDDGNLVTVRSVWLGQ
jgi:hypothetical protein